MTRSLRRAASRRQATAALQDEKSAYNRPDGKERDYYDTVQRRPHMAGAQDLDDRLLSNAALDDTPFYYISKPNNERILIQPRTKARRESLMSELHGSDGCSYTVM